MKLAHILLGHGSGGQLTHDLIENIFLKHFGNPKLDKLGDSAIFSGSTGKLAFTTDSFVVDPLFFPGANIGKLAIAGTVNDLAVAGAVPKFLSAAFILEEGLSTKLLEEVVAAMAEEAKIADIQIVTGDTKVVERGKCDKLFINTAGVGFMEPAFTKLDQNNIKPGDKILINGSIGDHGMAVMAARNQLNIQSPVQSDCASLNSLIQSLKPLGAHIRFMRDATRGGLATVATEICSNKSFGVELFESEIPVNSSVRGMCELLGFDPLYVANEGKVLLVVDGQYAADLLAQLRLHPLGKDAAIIGEIKQDKPGRCMLQTLIGGHRIVDMLAGEQLPRIC
ncbi:MAG: hydrogenase expression/formation protein HypE [Bacteroidetes bacterium]|jgi:hydrogenase expression/formation protein HypE|nr:hydrogenase expression/formation protein HypE [Bacteroidota bacterium]